MTTLNSVVIRIAPAMDIRRDGRRAGGGVQSKHDDSRKKLKVEVTRERGIRPVEDPIRSAVCTLATAALTRLGGKSPAAEFSADKYLLMGLYEVMQQSENRFIMVSSSKRDVWVYFIGTDSWVRGPKLPNHRDEHFGVVTGGIGDRRVMLFGGHIYRGGSVDDDRDDDASEANCSVLSLSVKSDARNLKRSLAKSEWEYFPPLPRSRVNARAVSVGDAVYVIGGRGVMYRDWAKREVATFVLFGRENVRYCDLDTCDVFSVNERRWIVGQDGATVVPPMSTTRRGAGVVAVGTRIYVIGGCNRLTSTSDAEVLDTETNTWTPLAQKMATPRSCFGVALVDNRFIWCIGGYITVPYKTQDGSGAVVEIFNVWQSPTATIEIYDILENRWNICPFELDTPMEGGYVTVVNHKLYMTGFTQYTSKGRFEDGLDIIDIDSQKITKLYEGNSATNCAVGF